MPFDPNVEPWLNARILIAEFGEDAGEEVWRLGQEASLAGRVGDIPKLVAVMKMIHALERTRGAGAAVH